MTRRLLVFLLLALGATVQAAQQRPRDAAPAATGTGSISGTVTTDEPQPRPLRRATVQLVAGGLAMPRSVVTDDTGRYQFVNLPAGNYTVGASRPGFVRAFYGSRRGSEPPGMPVAVVDGQPVTGIDMRLGRGGVITGTIRQPDGTPAAGINIQVMRVEMINGQRRMQLTDAPNLAAIRTDDRGLYRAYGLASGEYLVLVRSTPMLMNEAEIPRATPEQLAWADRALAGAATVTPGASTALPPPPAPGAPVAAAPVYYPGTTRSADATAITLGRAEERNGVDVTMEYVPTAEISGIVLDVDSTPMANAQVSLANSKPDPNDIFGAIMQRMGSRTSADGRFSITGVTPGDYAVKVRATPRSAAPAAGAAPASPADFAMQMMGGMFGGGGPLWASEPVSIAGRNVGDVTLRLAKGMNIGGTIVFESTTLPPGEAIRARVMLMPDAGGSSMVEAATSMMTNMAMAGVISDGTFTFNGVVPGKYLVNVMAPGMLITPGLPGGQWSLKSAMLKGADVSDRPFDVRPGEDLIGLVITLADRHTELTGRVVDQAGRPTGAFPIVVFSTDRAYWSLGSRRVQRARPSTDGKYSIVGLPPGEYFVCAAIELNEEKLYDPSFLEQLVPGSYKLTLAEGEKRTEDLKLGGGGP